MTNHLADLDLPATNTYSAATATLRETTKWLMAVITGAGLLFAAGTILPNAIALPDNAHNRSWAIGLAIASLVAAAIVIGLGAWVLSATSVTWGAKLSNRGKLDDRLDESGVLHLWGYSSAESFFNDAGRIASGTVAPSKAMVNVGIVIIDIDQYWTTRRRFGIFLAGAVLLVGAAIAMSSVGQHIVGESAPLEQPVAVTATWNSGGPEALASSIGCDEPFEKLWWTAGPWSDPLIEIHEADCAHEPIRWDPNWGTLEPAGS